MLYCPPTRGWRRLQRVVKQSTYKLGRRIALSVAQCRTLRLMTKTCLTLNAVQAGEKRMNKVRRLILRTKREDTPMCPYCYAVADAKYVHYGSGDARTSPFFCNFCGAVCNADPNDDALSDEERRKWSKPVNHPALKGGAWSLSTPS